MDEIFLFSHPSFAKAVEQQIAEQYAAQPVVLPSLHRLETMLRTDAPPAAVYIDDHALSPDDILRVAQLALTSQTPCVLVGVATPHSPVRAHLERMSIPFVDADAPDRVVKELAQRARLRQRIVAQAPMIAVAGAKGGIGKSLVVASLAVAMRKRGARVLVIDGDMTNSGVIPEFRIPPAYQSYLLLRSRDGGGFTPQSVADVVYRHEPSGVDFLLGLDEQSPSSDFVLGEWQSFMNAVQRLPEAGRDFAYDIVFVDTGPDMKKRPYAIDIVRRGGWALLPLHPGRKERQGVAIALSFLDGAGGNDYLARTMVLGMEPERGSASRLRDVLPLVQQAYPNVIPIGVIPRDARLISVASETPDAFISPLDIGPYRPFSRAIHRVCSTIADVTGIRLPHPEPAAPWWRVLWSQWFERDRGADMRFRPEPARGDA